MRILKFGEKFYYTFDGKTFYLEGLPYDEEFEKASEKLKEGEILFFEEMSPVTIAVGKKMKNGEIKRVRVIIENITIEEGIEKARKKLEGVIENGGNIVRDDERH